MDIGVISTDTHLPLLVLFQHEFIEFHYFYRHQVFSVTDRWECNQAGLRITGSHHRRSMIGTMPLSWRVSTEGDGGGTSEPGQPNITITISGYKLILEERLKLSRCLPKDDRMQPSGSSNIT